MTDKDPGASVKVRFSFGAFSPAFLRASLKTALVWV